jgi:methionine-rich copper-binding protein CopC/photosystem II stability/assembly factor-like uncharacterized protein
MGGKNTKFVINKTVAILTIAVLTLSNIANTAIAGEDEWVTNGPSDCNVQSVVISPKYSTNKTVYCATDNGIYKSTNGGQSWSVCGLSGTQVSVVAISPVQSTYDTLFAGTGTAVYKSTNSGSSWSLVTSVSGDVQSIDVSPAYSSDETVFVGSNGNGIFISSDGGDEWTQCSGDSSFTSRCVSSIAFSPAFSSDHTAFAATSDGGGIYKTTDSGDNWSQCASASSVGSFITAVSVSPNFSSDHTVYGGKYYSTDSGSTWSAVSGLSGVDVSSLAFSPSFSSDQTIFAGTYGDGVYQSTNGGTSWTQYDDDDDLDNLYIKSVKATPNYSSNHTIFAGTWGDGVYSCITYNDIVSPVVVSADPANSETGVAKDKTIAVTFSENIQSGSAYGMIVLKDSSNKTVTATKSVSGRVLSINPSSDLTLSSKYKAIIPAGAVKDSDGNSFAAQYTIAFTVAGAPDVTAPKVSTTDPITGAKTVASDKTITITFTESIQAGTAYANISLVDKSKAQIAFTKSISGKVLSIEPSSDLPSGTSYTLTIPASSIKDLSDNALASQSTVAFTVPVDKTAPTVSSTVPAANATNMSKDSTITVTFSENIQSGTAYETITLKDTASTSISLAKTISSKELTIDPATSLTPGVSYTLTLPASAVKDSSDNSLMAQFTLAFTVQADSETPSAPQGLKLVSAENNTIALSWESNTETDLAGYYVYKSIKGAAGAAVKLNSTPLTATAYSDTAVEAGKTYLYSVSAVDKTSHESAKSAEIQAALGQKTVEEEQPSTPFRDVAADAWYLEYVTALASSGVINGYVDGTFRPVNKVTRAEFSKMICAAMEWEPSDVSKASFGDVAGDFWGYDFIETAKSKGTIGGYADGTFRPNKYITRAEIAKIIAGTLNLAEGSSTLKDINSSWASSYIKACAAAGIVNGYSDGTFKPSDNATRAEVSKMIAALIEQKPDETADTESTEDTDL